MKDETQDVDYRIYKDPEEPEGWRPSTLEQPQHYKEYIEKLNTNWQAPDAIINQRVPELSIEYKLEEGARFEPFTATNGSAGYDLYLHQHSWIEYSREFLIDTGVSIWIKSNDWVGLVFSRSSTPITLKNAVGVIDSDYQGKILLRVDSYKELKNYPGIRIAQIIFLRKTSPSFQFVKEFSSVTARGVGGFGSTGH